MGGDWASVSSAVLVHLTAEVLLEEVRELLGETVWWQKVMLAFLGEAAVVSGQLPGGGDGMELTEVPPASWGHPHSSCCCAAAAGWMNSVTIHCSNHNCWRAVLCYLGRAPTAAALTNESDFA